MKEKQVTNEFPRMEREGPIGEITKIIPEFYVDLIRRVVPGAMILAFFYLLTGIPPAFSKEMSGWSIIVFLIVAYVVGLTMDAAGDWLTSTLSIRWAWRDFPAYEGDVEVVKKESGEVQEEEGEVEVMKEIFGMTDSEVRRPKKFRKLSRWKIPELVRTEVKKRDPEAKVLVPKLVAEEFLFKNLALGMPVVFVVATLVLPCVSDAECLREIIRNHPWFARISFIFAELLLVVAGMRRARRTIVRTRQWFHLLYKDQFARVVQGQAKK